MERRFKRLITSVAVCILILVCAGCGGNTLDENENENVSQLYRSFGFVKIEEMDGEERIAILKL